MQPVRDTSLIDVRKEVDDEAFTGDEGGFNRVAPAE